MLEKHDKRNKEHLINLICKRSNRTPNFALLIGAGASASSGVKTASQMIAEWRRQLYEQSKRSDPIGKWLQTQDWYQDEDEYSILFERVCDQPSHRRIYIEECVKEAKPSWGYIYSANIIAQNYFNVVFTPNFDDLLNEACFLYADLRPLVCAHDSAVGDIRVTSARPKVIKLHGDFLYDSIKNTVRETETLDKNMRDKFMQFGREYGLVVVGYGGNDRSIMDILDTMLMSYGYFPNGIYWCIRNKDKVSKKVDRLMRRENTYWVEIEGFDEFMAELHKGLALTLPDAVHDPYKATTRRLNTFILPKVEAKHPIIKDDIGKLEEQIKKFEEIISRKALGEQFDRLVPYELLGYLEFASNSYRDALLYYEKALIQNPNDVDVMQNIVDSYVYTEEFDKALEMSEKMLRIAPHDFSGYESKGDSLFYVGKFKDAISSYTEGLKYIAERSEEQGRVLVARSNALLRTENWEKALSDVEKALEIDPKDYTAVINRCIALKELEREEEAKTLLQDVLPGIEEKYRRACAFAVLGDAENMLKELEASIEEDSGRKVDAKSDPDFADYRDDRDFRRLVYEEKQQKAS